MVGRLGFEPRTLGLKVRCSDQAELPARLLLAPMGALPRISGLCLAGRDLPNRKSMIPSHVAGKAGARRDEQVSIQVCVGKGDQERGEGP